MPSNDVVLLADMLLRSRGDNSFLSNSAQEAYFVAKHYLREYKPAHDDILSSVVDGMHDGGIDAAYIFADGYHVRDDASMQLLGRRAHLDLIFIQVKNSSGFSETSIDKLVINIPKLLDFDRDEVALSRVFNPKVIEITRRFLESYRSLEMPTLSAYFGFASLKADHVHENTYARSGNLVDSFTACFNSANVEIDFLDASRVADMARELPVTNRSLSLTEFPLATDRTGGYIGVVSLMNYQKFITDESGKLDSSLFEANVRDYEGETGVNASIRSTLESDEQDVDFWWLNNGVTIVADKVQQSGKTLELGSPQIVNGLQTSHEIYKRSRDGSTLGDLDTRGILVKIIEAQDEAIRDRIIRATNSQTNLGISAVRATDKVQRQIEEHLRTHELYYERRKNFYLNQGVQSSKLVTIDQMGQAVLSVCAQLPHTGRGELSRIFEDEIYEYVFSKTHPIEMYSAAIRILRVCEEHLRMRYREQAEDFLLHLTMLATIAITRKHRPTAAEIAGTTSLPSPQLLDSLVKIVQQSFAAVAQRRGDVLLDKVAKDEGTTTEVAERAQRFLRTSHRAR
ncbi:AIPR family protein [Williamsia sp. MIQD14]|uniref:AIPR family protein n=1 Tax=Williamsia sp. MIQD14 TaxID=3425703 RepID=UPI003D9FC223